MARAMAGQPAQNLALVPSFIGQVQDAAALESIARLDLAGEGGPLGVGEAGDAGRGERYDAGGVVDAGGAAQPASVAGFERDLFGNDAGRAPAGRDPVQSEPQDRKSTRLNSSHVK